MKKFGHYLKKVQSLALAATLVVSMGLAVLPQPTAFAASTSLTAAPRVTFTFDDGLASSLTQAAPALQKYGLSGTNYVITDCVGMTTVPNQCAADKDVAYMTWAQIKTLRDTYGWNIGSHTKTHPLLASTSEDQTALLTIEQIRAELTESKAALAAQGIDAVDFAAPYGDYNNTVLAEAAKVYASFRGFADIGFNNWPYNDRLVINQQVQDGVTVAQVQAYIDQAITSNAWLVLTFHDIRATTSGNPEDYQFSTANLEAVAAYAAAKVTEGKIKVTNMHEALVTSDTNLLPNSSFDQGLTGWTTDDTTGTLVKADAGGNGSFVPGAATSPTNSIYISAGAANTHLFSPIVDVAAAKSYVLKCYVNVTSITGGEVAFYIDEYDVNGVYLSTQYKPGIRYAAGANTVYVGNVNFGYIPTSTAVAKARVYVTAQANSGIKAYVDNLLWLTDAPTVPPVTKPGDVTGDALVNLKDAIIVSNNWGKTSATLADGDANGDGLVGIKDAILISVNWSN